MTTVAPATPRTFSIASRARAYVELTKPRLVSLVMATVAAGYAMGAPGAVDLAGLASVLLGVWLVAAGGSALNMYVERHLDAMMHRTRTRPIPDGRVQPVEALALGALTSIAGLGALWSMSGVAPAFLAAASLANYVFLYTPLKTRSTTNTLVGAVTGALPPVIGWAAAAGSLGRGAWELFAILFVWQLPHFFALAWFCRADYARAGMRMLSVFDDDQGGMTLRQIAFASLVLVPVSLLPATSGHAGRVYFFAALLLGGAVALLALVAAFLRTRKLVRHVFLASLAYLPSLFLFMIADKVS